ncbi:MAG TPA: hypothetical protein VGG97_23615 [Bryobacteraceae bacterium]
MNYKARYDAAVAMPTRNVNLTDRLDRFIEASEVVCECLRLLEQREQENQAKLEWLRSAAKAGFDAVERGDYVTLHSGSEVEKLVQRIGQKVSRWRHT